MTCPMRHFLAPCVAFLALAIIPLSDAIAQVRIVNCDAPVQSRKRGVGVNSLSAADFTALAPGVSWYYNWGATPLSTKPASVTMDFVPMAWNGHPDFQTQIQAYLAAGNRPWRVFALNEPNWIYQANMTPEQCATTYLQLNAICSPYGIPVVAPHTMIGTAPEESITAWDPWQNQIVTYTFQEPFIAAFLWYCGATQPAALATHSYGNRWEREWIVDTMRSDFGKNVWMTEFNLNGSTSVTASIDDMIASVDYFERTSWIEGYAWFKERGVGANSLFNATSGSLTALGTAYVNMPVHDPNLYYRIRANGTLQAERYIAFANADIVRTTDSNGVADMKATAAGATVDYNIQVDTPGNYTFKVRATGATGPIKLYKGTTLLGTVNVTNARKWSTVSTTVNLPASGTQTLRLELGSAGQRVNWIGF